MVDQLPEVVILKKDRAVNVYDLQQLGHIYASLFNPSKITTEIVEDGYQPVLYVKWMVGEQSKFMRLVIDRTEDNFLTGEMIAARELYALIVRQREQNELDALLQENRRCVEWLAKLYQGWRPEYAHGFIAMSMMHPDGSAAYDHLTRDENAFIVAHGWIEPYFTPDLITDEGRRIAGLYARYYL